MADIKLSGKAVAYGSMATPIQQDTPTTSLAIIQHPHEEIHEGIKFMSSDVTSVAGIGGTILFLMITPNSTKRIHMLFGINSSLAVKIQFFESPTINNNGTGMDMMNQNRNSSTVGQTWNGGANMSDGAALQVFKTPTVASNGTQLHIDEIGGTSGPGASPGFTSADRNEHEWILKQNTKYLLLTTTLVNNTDVTTHLHWYEI